MTKKELHRHFRRLGKKGAAARFANLSPERRTEIARLAGSAPRKKSPPKKAA